MQILRRRARALRHGAALAVISILLGGCASGTLNGPKPAFDLNHDIAELSTHYGSATSISDYYSQPETRGRRDAFVAGRLTFYNLEYIRYIQQFSLSRATTQSAFDITGLSLNLANSIVGGEADRQALATASALLTGSRLSIEKNFFDDKTTGALVSQMNAGRKVALVPILAGLQTDVDKYPLNAALVDLQNYYMAGTIEGALQSVQVSAGMQEAKADQQITQYRTISFTQDLSATAIRKWLYPTGVSKDASGVMLNAAGQVAPFDADRAKLLRTWMAGNGWAELPIEQFLDVASMSQARRSAASALNVPNA